MEDLFSSSKMLLHVVTLRTEFCHLWNERGIWTENRTEINLANPLEVQVECTVYCVWCVRLEVLDHDQGSSMIQ